MKKHQLHQLVRKNANMLVCFPFVPACESVVVMPDCEAHNYPAHLICGELPLILAHGYFLRPTFVAAQIIKSNCISPVFCSLSSLTSVAAHPTPTRPSWPTL